MSRKKKDKSAQSTRQLMGIDSVKDYCIATRMGDLVFFIIKPTNISVLPDSSISARIYALLNVVKGQAEIEMLARSTPRSPLNGTRPSIRNGRPARSSLPYAGFWSRTAHTWTAFRC